MRVGVHLPLVDFGRGSPTGADLRAYARTAAGAGFSTVAANDHLVWRRPWLDGMTALAGVVEAARGMALATTVALPAVRHPVVLAKALASLALLAEGPVIAGLAPGSYPADYEAVGVPFDQRWARFDEGFRLVRALLHASDPPAGPHYPASGLRLAPLPDRPPTVWFGSWGSDVRLWRMARLADGWLASAYHTTPHGFAETRSRLDAHLRAAGREPADFPDAVATMWLYMTDDRDRHRHILEEVLAPALSRDPRELGLRLPIGPAEHCIDLLQRYRAAGARQVLLWPVHDPVAQLERFATHISPELGLGLPKLP